jgi:uncharacterized MAPEG superfamily protein
LLTILNNLGLDPGLFLIAVLVSAVVIVLAYYKFILGIVDPLTFFVLAMIANSTLMFALPWERAVKIEFVFFAFFFWLGFALRARIPRSFLPVRLGESSLFDLQLLLMALCTLIVIANLYLGMTAGFPIFSSNPSTAKVENLTGGLGVVRRINMAPYIFLCSGCMLLVSLGYRRRLAIILLGVASIFIALSGSKSALLPVLYVQVFVLAHRGLWNKTKWISKTKKSAFILFLLAALIALLVASKDQGGIQLGLLFLAQRMLYAGDIILYYYPVRGSIQSLAHANGLDYISYLFQSTLGLFRLIPYRDALGTVIMGSGETGFGPNAQYFVRADIFFGPIYGCIYCFVIGYFVGLMRRGFFTFSGGNATKLTLRLTLAVSATALAVESQLFVTDLVDLLLMLVPLYCLARLVRFATQAPYGLTGLTQPLGIHGGTILDEGTGK